MTYDIYTLRDHYSVFGTPFCHANENTAKRYFARLIHNSDGDIAFSPGDYDLYRIGTFNDESGLVHVVGLPEFVCNGSDLIGVKMDEK